ncbi:MAG TPA: tetratricopeptide repeat protein [Xanthobacteraceae bacterium]|nr:tetratricopeptide repeat protein [Xanthobacteraceae bacterium]
MSDIFHEVDEEVRREQLNKLWQRYGKYLVALCVLFVAGVAAWRGYGWWEAKQAAISGAAFEQAAELAQAGKVQEAEAAFAKLASDGTPGYRVLAGMRQAAQLAHTDTKAAVAAYDRIAADSSAGQAVQDLAAIRAALLLVDSASYADMRTRLEPLTAGDRVFRHSARELLALSAWKSGDLAAAKQWTDLIVTDPQTPSGMRSRVEVLSQLISAATAKG